MIEKDCADQRHLFMRINGEYYFIPAESIGCPLEYEGDESKRGEFERKVLEFVAASEADGSKAEVEFAVWLKHSELLWGVLGGKG